MGYSTPVWWLACPSPSPCASASTSTATDTKTRQGGPLMAKCPFITSTVQNAPYAPHRIASVCPTGRQAGRQTNKNTLLPFRETNNKVQHIPCLPNLPALSCSIFWRRCASHPPQENGYKMTASTFCHGRRTHRKRHTTKYWQAGTKHSTHTTPTPTLMCNWSTPSHLTPSFH